jgi:hypothetical protein
MRARKDTGADLKVTPIGDSVVDAKALIIQGTFGESINGLAYKENTK